MSELVLKAQERITSGVIAYDAVQKLKVDPVDPAARNAFELHKRDLGYALLLKRYVADPRTSSPQLIASTAGGRLSVNVQRVVTPGRDT